LVGQAPGPVEAGVGEKRLEDGEEAGELADDNHLVFRIGTTDELLKKSASGMSGSGLPDFS
jgi:hypothetical protein